MGKVAGVVLAVVVLCPFAAVQDAPESDFRALQVDAGKVIGEIRSFQGLNGQPTPAMEGLPNLVEQYKDLRLNRNNGVYQLSITHLPWRQKEFTLQRYRLSQAQDLAMVDEKSVKGDALKLSNSLPPDSVELIVLQQK
jgi:hypothetical protein